MELRDYQAAAIKGIFAAWENCRSALAVLPTGCGKTIVFASVIRRLLAGGMSKTEGYRRVLVLAHREELIMQAKEKIVAVVPNAQVGIEMGEFKAHDFFGQPPDVVVSSIQTQCAPYGEQGEGRRRRMEKFNPKDFAAIIVDEAHHATCPSYRKVVDWYMQGNPNCRLLGVTATPDRADELALGTVFEKVAASYDVADAIRDGWLVPIEQRLVTVGSLDFSKIKTTAGDLNQGELAEVMEDERNLHEIASPVLEILKAKRAIIFATSVRQAERLAEILNRSADGKVADWLCGKTPREVRHQKMADFKDGKTRYMVNVGVLTEGFDDAGVEAVVMARPTKSRALYAQMIGRATRPAAEIAAKLGMGNEGCGTSDGEWRRQLIAKSSKPSCLVLDFVGNSGRHKLITSADILGGKYPDEVVERARRKAARKTVNMSDALEEARLEYEEIERRKNADAARRKAIRAIAPFCLTKVNPFDAYDLPPVPVRSGEPPRRYSPNQARFLREYFQIDPERLPYVQGKQLLDEYGRRKNAGLASLKQVRLLRRKGVPVPMRFDEARRVLDRLVG